MCSLQMGDKLCEREGGCVEEWSEPLRISTRWKNALFPFTPELLIYSSLLLVVSDALGLSPLYSITSSVENLVQIAFGGPSLASRVSSSLLIVLPFLLLLLLLTRLFLWSCLHYTGWLYEELGKPPSLPSRLFMILIMGLNKIPKATFGYQGIVPKQRLPGVKETTAKILRSLRPLMSDKEMDELREMANEFERELAPELQMKLRLKWLFSTNYVSDWWKEVVYMRYRSSLMKTNVGCADIIYRPTTSIQAARAAHVTLLRQHFCREVIEEQVMKPVTLGGIPMCNQQYHAFHRTLRVPHEKSDISIQLPPASHIAVYHDGCWYKVPVYDGDRLINSAELERALQSLIDRKKEEPQKGEQFLSALTCGPRDLWAKVREEKFSEGLNADSLSVIESALEIVFLDDEDGGFDEKDPTLIEREYKRALTGHGYRLWCDKPCAYFFSTNGRFTSNAEHSVGDAMVHVHIREYIKYHEAYSPSYGPDGHCIGEVKWVPTPERVRWSIDDETVSSINEAYSHAKAVADDFDNACIVFKDYGKDLIKKAKVSPDAFIQMALQMAYYRDQGGFALTYEPAVLRLFKEGRTETIRSCTEESCAFVRSMNDELEPPSSRLSLLRSACSRHQEMTRDAMAGKGADRHLFALYVLSKYLQKNSPFLERVFSMNFELSSSQTPQHQTAEFMPTLNKARDMFWPAGGFCTPDGSKYGVCYTIGTTGDLLSFHITTWKSLENTSADRFRRHLLDVLAEMRSMVEKAIA